MELLTKKQGDVFEFIKKFIDENHYPPNVREIANGVGLKSCSTAHAHLLQLKTKGYINWAKESSRTIVILKR